MAVLVFAAACAAEPAGDASSPIMKEIRAAPPASRSTRGMLSVAVEYQPCSTPANAAARGCDFPAAQMGPEWTEIGGRVAQGGSSPGDLHATAVLDLLAGARGNSLDRSISYLEMITRIAPTASRYVDLSAALLARADRDSDARSSLAALDAAARARRLDTASAPARFNLALALEDLGLYATARRELETVGGLDAPTGWKAEARRLGLGLVVDSVPTAPDSTSSPESLGAFAREHAAEARALSWERLAAWGQAYKAGNAVGAERNLRLAEAAGTAVAESHVDRAIRDAVHAIRAASERERRTLAEAHVAYVVGLRAARANSGLAAERAFVKAQRARGVSPALTGWAEYSAGNNRLGLNDRSGAERAMRSVIASPAADRYPALAARARWTLGVVLLRDRRLADAARSIESSLALYRQLGEVEFIGAMTGQLGEIVNVIGDSREGYGLLAEGMRLLRDYPLSNWRHNAMLVMSRAAALDGYMAAAEAIDAEDEWASRAANRIPALIESHLNRARIANASRDSAGASSAVERGRELAAQLPPGNVRQQLESDLAVEASGVKATPKDRAALDAAIRYYAQIENSIKELRAYSARASLAAREGDLAGADADLDRALSIYEARRANVTDPNQKSLLTRQATIVGDALMLLRLTRNDTAGAFRAKERVRSSPPRLELTEPGSAMVIDYSIVADTLVVFALRGSRIVASMRSGGALALLDDIERANLALERGAVESEWRPLTEGLYQKLIAPVAPLLQPSDSTVTIIAAGPLSRVPFAALRNSATGEFLIDRHALRFLSSFQQTRSRRLRLAGGSRIVLVSEPAIDRRSFPGLAPLRGASAEVDSIARVFPSPLILRGADADTASLKRALGRADVFHFAGHAIFDDARPHRSQLVSGAAGLTAESIAAMRLPSLELVVLSACETNRSGAGSGFLGLAESFTTAGARGVIGSTWKVDDEATRRLMQEFYKSLSRSGDPAQALAKAQRAMRGSSPGTWAAFRYAGQ